MALVSPRAQPCATGGLKVRGDDATAGEKVADLAGTAFVDGLAGAGKAVAGVARGALPVAVGVQPLIVGGGPKGHTGLPVTDVAAVAVVTGKTLDTGSLATKRQAGVGRYLRPLSLLTKLPR